MVEFDPHRDVGEPKRLRLALVGQVLLIGIDFIQEASM